MSVPLAPVTITPGGPINVPLGGVSSVGAVVIDNESGYGLQAFAGGSGIWIPVQTADRLDCNSMGFNGTITLVPNDYLNNASEAPSQVALLTVYAPGEAIPDNYPASLVRMTNVGGGTLSVTTQVINDIDLTGATVVEARPSGQGTSRLFLSNDGSIQSYFGVSDPPTLAFLSGAGGVQIGTLGFRTDSPLILNTGFQETGYVSNLGVASGAAQDWGAPANFKTVMTNVPSSITLSATGGSHNCSASTVAMTIYGFTLLLASTAAGSFSWAGQYTTVGNCLLAVDATARTFDHHCELCGHVSSGVAMSALTAMPSAIATGMQRLTYTCPSCGAVECFTTSLTEADAADTSPQGSGQYRTTRGAQATLIRQLMTAVGLAVAASATGTPGVTPNAKP